MNWNSFLWTPDETNVIHKGKKESDNSQYDVEVKLNVLLMERIHYTGHIHTDEYSYIQSTDGRIIYHKGYGQKEIDPSTPLYI
jgi:hypothetical protein